MKTVKEVAGLTGVSIRTLRYYDEIGLLKPTQVTEAGYRLYDSKALAKLQEIMFFRELDIPLADIREIMGNPAYDRARMLAAQKDLLEQKRNRLNGIIELITDVMKGVNTMSFEAFDEEDINKMLDHMLEVMPKETLDQQIEKYGSIEKYREFLSAGYQNEKAVSDVIRWYGGKEKAVQAVLSSTGNLEDIKPQQDEHEIIYRQFVTAKQTADTGLANDAVMKLAENYKNMFHLDNARNILLDLAKEYLEVRKLAEITDKQYGIGMAEYIAGCIQQYYGV